MNEIREAESSLAGMFGEHMNSRADPGTDPGTDLRIGLASGESSADGSIDKESSEGDFSEERREAAYRVVLESAIRSLGRREHGRRELERKLLAKGHAAELVVRVLGYCDEYDLQSDARYVESYIRARILKGYGPVKIRQELSSRGIGEIELESQLTESTEFWVDQAEAVLAKKFRSAPTNRDDWNTQARFLARRGFPSDLIYRVLGSHTD